jgi:hypothetical protein
VIGFNSGWFTKKSAKVKQTEKSVAMMPKAKVAAQANYKINFNN